MSEGHGAKLVRAGQLPCFVVSLVLVDASGQLPPGQVVHDLGKNDSSFVHDGLR
jgi:hypothetical protein